MTTSTPEPCPMAPYTPPEPTAAAQKAYESGHWCGECRFGVVENPHCCTSPADAPEQQDEERAQRRHAAAMRAAQELDRQEDDLRAARASLASRRPATPNRSEEPA